MVHYCQAPYTTQGCIDNDGDHFHEEDLYLIQTPDGASSANQVIARMNPANTAWQNTIRCLAERVMTDNGAQDLDAKGVYLDSFGRQHFPDHSGSTPKGNGSWLPEAAYQLASGVQDIAVDDHVVAGEFFSEYFMGVIDVVLNFEASRPSDAGLYAAAFSDYQLMAGPHFRLNENLAGRAMKMGTALTWGAQTGAGARNDMCGPWATDPVGTYGCETNHHKMLNELTQARTSLHRFLSYGEYLGPAEDENVTVTADWCEELNCGCLVVGALCGGGGYDYVIGAEHVDPTHPDDRVMISVTTPALRAGRCQTEAGEKAIVLANVALEAGGTSHIPVPAAWSDLSVQLCSADDATCQAMTITESGGSYYVEVGHSAWKDSTGWIVRYLKFE
jgi:hypothetical protein